MSHIWPLLLLLLLLATTFSLSLPSSLLVPQNDRINCYTPIILAPFEDCRAVLSEMARQYSSPSFNIPLTWGRPIKETNGTHVSLPWGFQLRHWPFPGMSKRCEIHVDNTLENWDRTDVFRVMDVVNVGLEILNDCYPTENTGRGYPSGRRFVYATTIYVPKLQGKGGISTVLEGVGRNGSVGVTKLGKTEAANVKGSLQVA